MFQVPTSSRVASFLGLCQSTMPAILEPPPPPPPPSHQGNIEGSHKGHSPPRATCFLQNQGHPFSGGNNDLQWWIDSTHLNMEKTYFPHQHDDFLRFVKNRMECPPRFNPDRGKMVKKRGQFPHKFSGTKSSIPSF